MGGGTAAFGISSPDPRPPAGSERSQGERRLARGPRRPEDKAAPKETGWGSRTRCDSEPPSTRSSPTLTGCPVTRPTVTWRPGAWTPPSALEPRCRAEEEADVGSTCGRFWKLTTPLASLGTHTAPDGHPACRWSPWALRTAEAASPGSPPLLRVGDLPCPLSPRRPHP